MSGHRPIVVGIDGSPSSLQAVSWAAREAALRSSPLSLITTMFVPGRYGVPIGVPASFFQDEERDGKERLERAAQTARAAVPGHDIEIDTTVCTGTPAGELLDRSADASMLVVGANRRGIVDRAVLGSVSSAVATHASCPVAVIRGEPDRDINDIPGPIVVGVDGSQHSEPAISTAFEEGRPSRKQVCGNRSSLPFTHGPTSFCSSPRTEAAKQSGCGMRPTKRPCCPRISPVVRRTIRM